MVDPGALFFILDGPAMITVILVIHLLLAIALIGVIMLQQSEGGGLGIGGGGSGGGMGGFMTGRAAASMLTRATAIIATAFMATSLTLAILADGGRSNQRSIVDQPSTSSPAPANQPAVPNLPSLPPLPNSPAR